MLFSLHSVSSLLHPPHAPTTSSFGSTHPIWNTLWACVACTHRCSYTQGTGVVHRIHIGREHLTFAAATLLYPHHQYSAHCRRHVSLNNRGATPPTLPACAVVPHHCHTIHDDEARAHTACRVPSPITSLILLPMGQLLFRLHCHLENRVCALSTELSHTTSLRSADQARNVLRDTEDTRA